MLRCKQVSNKMEVVKDRNNYNGDTKVNSCNYLFSRGCTSTLETCGTAKATNATNVGPYSLMSKPQRLYHAPLCGDLKGGNKNLLHKVGKFYQFN
jgi:hypothetical protein